MDPFYESTCIACTPWTVLSDYNKIWRVWTDVSLLGIAVCLILPIIIIFVVQYLQWRLEKSNMRGNGLQLAKIFPNQGIFAWAFWYKMYQASREGDVQREIRSNFMRAGRKTFRTTGLIQDTLHVMDQENLRVILNQTRHFGKAPRKDGGWFAPSWAPFLEGGMMVSDGQEWKQCRTAVTGYLNKRNIAQLDKLEPFVQKFLSRVSVGGQSCDYQNMLISFSKDVVLGFLMGLDAEVSEVKWDSIRKDADYCSYTIYRRFRKTFLERLFFHETVKEAICFPRAARRIHHVIDDGIEEAVMARSTAERLGGKAWEQYKSRYGFIQHLLERFENNKSQVRWEILEIIGAGTDTTASLLVHTLYHLSRQSDLWKALWREVEEELGGRRPNESDLEKMKLLNYVIKETLRYNPSTSGATRFALQDTILPFGGGSDENEPIFVPKGTLILTSASAIHRDESIWGDPHVFRPHRWLEMDKNDPRQKGDLNYMPFSYGRRQCPGKDYALLMTRYFLIRFCQTFKSIRSHDTDDYKSVTRLGTTIRNGLWLSIYEDDIRV